MDFSLNETQQMLSDSIARYVTREHADAPAFAPQHWAQFAEMGLLGLTVPERLGGSGGSAVDVACVMEQLGRGCVRTPYAFGAVYAGSLLADAGSESQQDSWLAPLASGESMFACAVHEIEARHDLLPLTTRAARKGDAFVLDGHKSNVWYAEHTSHVIVAARTAGAPTDEQGISLFVLPADAPGLRWRHFPTVDGGCASELMLEQAVAAADQALGPIGGAHTALRMAERRATAALAAESVGLAAVMLDMTIEYARTRKQFGQAIGGFQALQHRMVDMLIEVEQARSLAWFAAASFDAPDVAAQDRAVSAAKARAGIAGRKVGQDAIQMHGGMGMTDELALSRYFKRQMAIEQSLGDTAFHVERFSRFE
ncbi:MAG: acyl-CoA dehydrogenase family protein [Cupriavidus necator]